MSNLEKINKKYDAPAKSQKRILTII